MNLNDFLSVDKGTNSLAAIVIGNAEGTRTPGGGFTRHFNGHPDPGNGKHNMGSFSYQDSKVSSAAEADRKQLTAMRDHMDEYKRAATTAGLDPNNSLLAAAYFDSLNQSPSAAKHFLNQMPYLKEHGITPETVTEARVRTFADPKTGERYVNSHGQHVGGGFANIARQDAAKHHRPFGGEADVIRTIRADQSRRVNALAAALQQQGLGASAGSSSTGGQQKTQSSTAPSAPNRNGAPRGNTSTSGAATRPASRTTSIDDNTPATNGAHYTLKNSNIRLSGNAGNTLGQIADEYHRRTGKDLVITDGSRTPHEQAVQVYRKIKLGKADGLYRNKAALSEIKQAYNAGRAAGKSEAEIINDMSGVIENQAAHGTYISRHLRGGAADVRRNGEGGMDAADRGVFIDVVKQVTGNPPLDEGDHYHLQF